MTIPFKELVHARLLYVAFREHGQKEIFGPESNPRILEYLQSCRRDFDLDEIPWCSAFLNWCFDRAHVNATGTKSALARSWMTWGEETRDPVPGAVVVLQMEKSMHVGLFIARTNKGIMVLGGNQVDEVNIKTFQAHRLVSYRVTKDLV